MPDLSELFRAVKKYVLVNDFCWRVIVYSRLSSLSDLLTLRKYFLHDSAQSWIDEYCPDHTVQSGPFKGLEYRSITSINSVLYPKLIGCYESELHAIVHQLIAMNPATVIDIGSAEGYYAVGFARRCPTSTIYAFDIAIEAQEACRSLARQNNVLHQLVLGGEIDSEKLVSLVKTCPAGVIISDCEGYEGKLFSDDVVPHLSDWQLIIETHDFLVPGISEKLKDIFLRTHSVLEVKAISDFDKVSRSAPKELDGLNTAIKMRLVSEERPEGMRWLYLTPKN